MLSPSEKIEKIVEAAQNRVSGKELLQFYKVEWGGVLVARYGKNNAYQVLMSMDDRSSFYRLLSIDGNMHLAIEAAARHGQKDVMFELLENGACQNLAVRGVAEFGDTGLALQLIEEGARPQYAAEGAAMANNVALVSQFEDDPECYVGIIRGYAREGNIEQIKKYLEQLDPSREEQFYVVALSHAAYGGHRELIAYLIENGGAQYIDELFYEGAAFGGNTDIVMDYLEQDGIYWSSAMCGAVRGGHISHYKWMKALYYEDTNNHELLNGIGLGGHIHLYEQYFYGQNRRVGFESLNRVLQKACIAGQYTLLRHILLKAPSAVNDLTTWSLRNKEWHVAGRLMLQTKRVPSRTIRAWRQMLPDNKSSFLSDKIFANQIINIINPRYLDSPERLLNFVRSLPSSVRQSVFNELQGHSRHDLTLDEFKSLGKAYALLFGYGFTFRQVLTLISMREGGRSWFLQNKFVDHTILLIANKMTVCEFELEELKKLHEMAHYFLIVKLPVLKKLGQISHKRRKSERDELAFYADAIKLSADNIELIDTLETMSSQLNNEISKVEKDYNTKESEKGIFNPRSLFMFTLFGSDPFDKTKNSYKKELKDTIDKDCKRIARFS